MIVFPMTCLYRRGRKNVLTRLSSRVCGWNVLVQVEDVVRVKGVLERREPGQLLGRIRTSYASHPVVAQHVHIDPARVALQAGRALPGSGYSPLVLSRIRPAGGADVLERCATLAKRGRLVGHVCDRPA